VEVPLQTTRHIVRSWLSGPHEHVVTSRRLTHDEPYNVVVISTTVRDFVHHLADEKEPETTHSPCGEITGHVRGTRRTGYQRAHQYR
jgi:hypothetical protein